MTFKKRNALGTMVVGYMVGDAGSISSTVWGLLVTARALIKTLTLPQCLGCDSYEVSVRHSVDSKRPHVSGSLMHIHIHIHVYISQRVHLVPI